MRTCDLVLMDAGPLIKLALADQLDLLLCFDRHVFIPDEVEFEAVEKHAWEHQCHLTPDKVRLKTWIERQSAAGRVIRPQTLIGEIARKKRESGVYSPGARNHRRNTGELAAHDFFNHRDEEGYAGQPAVLLMDDRPAQDSVRLHNLDVHLLSTYAMLIALEQMRLLQSAQVVWAQIEAGLPTAERVDVDESVRGDTDYKTAIALMRQRG